MSTYILDQTWDLEAERLHHLEAFADPITTDHLTRLGVGQGWRCLEVGAGRGSIASWLADRVGESGSVVAIDLDLTLLEKHRRPNLELRRVDVLEDRLPPSEFDLVHARHVVGHLGARRPDAIRLMAAALKPGGYLVVEDNDIVWNQASEWPCSNPELGRVLHKAWTGLSRLFEKGGYDAYWGRRIGSALREAGLVEIQGEARARIGSGGSGWHAIRLTVLRFRQPLIGMGALTEVEFERLIELTSNPAGDLVGISPLMVTVWGRRP